MKQFVNRSMLQDTGRRGTISSRDKDCSLSTGHHSSSSDNSNPWTDIKDPNAQDGLLSPYGRVLKWDAAAMQYASLSYEGRATLSWLEDDKSDSKASEASQVKATPMLATIDRRPRQQRKRKACSVVSFVALGHTAEIEFHRLHPPNDDKVQPTCAVCYQWSNHIVAQQHIIDLVRTMNRNSTVYRPNDLGVEDTTVCITGKATFTERQRWRSAYWHYSRNERFKMGKQEDERDTAHGFVWAVWCELPEPQVNTQLQQPLQQPTTADTSCQTLHPTNWGDELQRVYYTSSFTFHTRRKIGGGSSFRVNAQWPWRALVLNEQEFDPPLHLPKPQRHDDLKLLWAEGPLWQREEFGPSKNRLRWNMSFAATLKRAAPSGISERFLLSILQQATIAPNSTRLLGVVDSHAQPTYKALMGLLRQRVDTWLPWCSLPDSSHYEPLTLVYMKHCMTKGIGMENHEVTLGELLERRHIQIKVIPFPIRPSLFGTVRQMGQHAFSAWMGIRFSPEYHVIMYMDADAMPFIHPDTHGQKKLAAGSLQEVIFDRMFGGVSEEGTTTCVNQRMEALEYAVLEQSVATELACVNQLLTNPVELNRTVTYCTGFIGHVIARCDALGMLWIHDNYAKDSLDDLPPGTSYCSDEQDGDDNDKNDNDHMFPPDELVEVHLRSRGRRGYVNRCTCRLNQRGS